MSQSSDVSVYFVTGKVLRREALEGCLLQQPLRCTVREEREIRQHRGEARLGHAQLLLVFRLVQGGLSLPIIAIQMGGGPGGLTALVS